MTHKIFANVIVLCLKTCGDDCCIFDDCPLFKDCFPEAYKSWQKKAKKEKRESVKV